MNVLIIGATSGIAQALTRRLAQRGDRLWLAARDKDKLAAVAADARVRGAADVRALAFDAMELGAHDDLVRQADAEAGGLDVVLVAHGVLPEAQRARADVDEALRSLTVNLMSPIAIAATAANLMEARGKGAIIVIGSVAGDRGRQSNYTYGAAKGGLDVYLQGLRHRMHGTGVRVVTVKPGFVDTPMTAHLQKGMLFASADKVAARIQRAIDGNSSGVIYAPGWWRPILFAVRNTPSWLFHRTKL